MFIRKSQAEERQYQEGRRDGYHGEALKERSVREPAYAAGVRAGMIESLTAEGTRTCSSAS